MTISVMLKFEMRRA